jgi:hypothetical protein
MFAILFSILVVMALLSICGEFIMRIRLTKRASRDKIAWWRRGGDEVAAMYEEVFPHSRLPLLRRLMFWLLVAFSACVLVSSILWKSN